VSRDLPLREIGNRGIRSPGDKGSRLSKVETLEQLWAVRFKEVTCREITRFGKSGIGDSGVLLTIGRALALINPDGREVAVIWEEVISTNA
jgi:hypothetical protein